MRLNVLELHLAQMRNIQLSADLDALAYTLGIFTFLFIGGIQLDLMIDTVSRIVIPQTVNGRFAGMETFPAQLGLRFFVGFTLFILEIAAFHVLRETFIRFHGVSPLIHPSPVCSLPPEQFQSGHHGED